MLSDYPKEVSCTVCTLRMIIEDPALESFVQCSCCGSKPCIVCGEFFDEAELLLHVPACEGRQEVWSVPAVPESGELSLWRDKPQSLDVEIDVEWASDLPGEVRYEACTVLSVAGGLRVEYAGKEDRVWVHGLDFSRELTADERLDAILGGLPRDQATRVKWCRCEATGVVTKDMVLGRDRRWRYREALSDDDDRREDNGAVRLKDKKNVDLAATAFLKNGPRASGRAPEKKRRKCRRRLVGGEEDQGNVVVFDESDEVEGALAVEAVLAAATTSSPFVAIVALLENLDLPFSERRNVLRKKAKRRPRGVNVGVTNLRREGWAALSQTVQYPEFHVVAQALTAFFRATSPDPDASFTSVQINRGDAGDDAANLHTDRNNAGPSWIVGLGDYVGGELWTRDNGLTDIRHSWARFDGRRYHAALPYTGKVRYSLVYWCHANAMTIESSHRNQLERLGFAFPTSNDEVPTLSQNDDKAAARLAFRKCLAEHRAGVVPETWADEDA